MRVRRGTRQSRRARDTTNGSTVNGSTVIGRGVPCARAAPWHSFPIARSYEGLLALHYWHYTKSQRWESNPQPPHYECGALPIEATLAHPRKSPQFAVSMRRYHLRSVRNSNTARGSPLLVSLEVSQHTVCRQDRQEVREKAGSPTCQPRVGGNPMVRGKATILVTIASETPLLVCPATALTRAVAAESLYMHFACQTVGPAWPAAVNGIATAAKRHLGGRENTPCRRQIRGKSARLAPQQRPIAERSARSAPVDGLSEIVWYAEPEVGQCGVSLQQKSTVAQCCAARWPCVGNTLARNDLAIFNQIIESCPACCTAPTCSLG